MGPFIGQNKFGYFVSRFYCSPKNKSCRLLLPKTHFSKDFFSTSRKSKLLLLCNYPHTNGVRDPEPSGFVFRHDTDSLPRLAHSHTYSYQLQLNLSYKFSRTSQAIALQLIDTVFDSITLLLRWGGSTSSRPPCELSAFLPSRPDLIPPSSEDLV